MSPARKRPHPLTTEEIVAAARSIIAADGIDACSMRALSARLGVDPPAVYRRIAGKEELLALVADDVMGDLELPPKGPWRAELAQLMMNLRSLALTTPSLVELNLRSHPHGDNALRFVAAAQRPLRRARFTAAQAAFAIAALTTYTLGLTHFGASLAWGVPPRRLQAQLRASRGTHTETDDAFEVLAGTLAIDPDDVFRFGLERLISGLARRRP